MTNTEATRGIGEVVAEDGRAIEVAHWPVEHGTRGAIQILHGLAEHIGRYDRFARACNQRGFAVVGHNHRGHGAGAERPGRAGSG